MCRECWSNEFRGARMLPADRGWTGELVRLTREVHRAPGGAVGGPAREVLLDWDLDDVSVDRALRYLRHNVDHWDDKTAQARRTALLAVQRLRHLTVEQRAAVMAVADNILDEDGHPQPVHLARPPGARVADDR